MIKLLGSFLIVLLGLPCFAKTLNPLCNGVTGSAFSTGDGSTSNPFLICNLSQYARLGSETALLTRNFKLGADLNFTNQAVNIIGSNTAPYQADFNGDGYSLSNMTIVIPRNRTNFLGPFGYLSNANIRNLTINGIAISAATTAFQHLGGLAGYAQNSTISNIQINNLNANAPSRSGGLVGYAVNVVTTRCSTSGSLRGHAYASGLGGLFGRVDNSSISTSSSTVNISIINNNLSRYFGEKVGGLFGFLVNTQVNNVYSLGNIDFSNIANPYSSKGIGGLAGVISGGAMNYSYYSGKLINLLGTDVGGAVGSSTGATIQNVIWNQFLSGQTNSAGGIPSTDCLMTQSSYWDSYGFDATIWNLVDGAFPTLL